MAHRLSIGVNWQGEFDREKVFIGDRQQVQHRAAFAALALVRKVVRHGHREDTP